MLVKGALNNLLYKHFNITGLLQVLLQLSEPAIVLNDRRFRVRIFICFRLSDLYVYKSYEERGKLRHNNSKASKLSQLIITL